MLESDKLALERENKKLRLQIEVLWLHVIKSLENKQKSSFKAGIQTREWEWERVISLCHFACLITLEATQVRSC